MRGLGLLLVCAACGDGLPASTADAGPDDPRGLVSLAFLAADGERLVGHRVFFQDRDSSLVLSTRTDAEGRANAFMHPGGFVSLVETRGNSSLIYTYAGVKPGDELTIDQRGTPGNVVEIEVSIPPAAGAITYQLYTSCTSNAACKTGFCSIDGEDSAHQECLFPCSTDPDCPNGASCHFIGTPPAIEGVSTASRKACYQ